MWATALALWFMLPPSAARRTNSTFLQTRTERSFSGKSSSSGWGSRPNILYIVADDWGWADAGWHQKGGDDELQTPNLDALVKEGLELDRHYVYCFCSPTRAAIQTGRNPVHVNVRNDDFKVWNPEDPQGGFAGIPRDMTGIAEKLRYGGYATYMYGKWDAGMATPYHTPYGRGYEKSVSYFGHGNGYWDHSPYDCKSIKSGKQAKVRDLWGTTGPAREYINPEWCSQENQQGCVYEDQLFTNLVMQAIEESAENRDKPFFINWSPHIVHNPLEVPNSYLDRFAHIDHEIRRIGHAMIYFMDEAVGNVTALLKSKGLWDNTLVVVHADNGGELYHEGVDGAGNNYPLKGAKMTNWEGGVRVNSFVSGGFLPWSVRGTKQDGLMAGWDWYATFAHLAGVDEFDSRGAEKGLPPQDTYNMWPLISGETSQSPRSELALGYLQPTKGGASFDTLVGGLIKGHYKIVLGHYHAATWTGPAFPTTKDSSDPWEVVEECGTTPEDGCLYDIYADPEERVNLAKDKPDVFDDLLGKAQKVQATVYTPERGTFRTEACDFGVDTYDGFFGPFHEVSEDTWADAATRYEHEAKHLGLQAKGVRHH